VKRLKTRITWGFIPVTRVIKSKKQYNRQQQKQQLRRGDLG